MTEWMVVILTKEGRKYRGNSKFEGEDNEFILDVLNLSAPWDITAKKKKKEIQA